MSWSRARSHADSGRHPQQPQTLAYHFHVLPLMKKEGIGKYFVLSYEGEGALRRAQSQALIEGKLIEAVADAAERGVRDQQVDELIIELASRFEKGKQLLDSLAPPTTVIMVDVSSQKQIVEDYRNQLENRRDLLAKYKTSVEQVYTPPAI